MPPLRKVIETEDAPKAIGQYSQAIMYSPVSFDSKLVFTAGQIGMDPQTGMLVEGGIVAETKRVMENLQAVLQAAYTSFERVIKVTIYLVDMNDFQVVNKIYAQYTGDKPPARSTVQVQALPKGALIEIDCIAAST
ncbi:RidA family protein [bacterium]|nr:RidA family protein [bacterium]